MLTSITIFVLLIGGALCQDNECRRREKKACESKAFYNLMFPESKEELDSLCSQGIGILNCIYNGAKKCGDDEDSSAEIRFLKGTILYLETELCNEDSNAYKVVSRNLPCIEKNLSVIRHTCSGEHLEAKKNAIIQHIQSYLLEGNADTGLLADCVHVLYRYACAAATLGKGCDHDLSEIFSEMVVNVDFYFGDECPPEVPGMMPDAVEALRLMGEAKEKVENDLKRRKK